MAGKRTSLYRDRSESYGRMEAVDAMSRGSDRITQATSTQTGYDRPTQRYERPKTLTVGEAYGKLKRRVKKLWAN